MQLYMCVCGGGGDGRAGTHIYTHACIQAHTRRMAVFRGTLQMAYICSVFKWADTGVMYEGRVKSCLTCLTLTTICTMKHVICNHSLLQPKIALTGGFAHNGIKYTPHKICSHSHKMHPTLIGKVMVELQNLT